MGPREGWRETRPAQRETGKGSACHSPGRSALASPFDFEGADVGAGAVLAGEVMPEPAEYLSEVQRDGKPLGADIVYWETWRWLDEHGCEKLVAPRLIEEYAQTFARYVQCGQAISKFGLLGKHPTTGTAIASLFVAVSQSFGKQANHSIIHANNLFRAQTK